MHERSKFVCEHLRSCARFPSNHLEHLERPDRIEMDAVEVLLVVYSIFPFSFLELVLKFTAEQPKHVCRMSNVIEILFVAVPPNAIIGMRTRSFGYCGRSEEVARRFHKRNRRPWTRAEVNHSNCERRLSTGECGDRLIRPGCQNILWEMRKSGAEIEQYAK